MDFALGDGEALECFVARCQRQKATYHSNAFLAPKDNFSGIVAKEDM